MLNIQNCYEDNSVAFFDTIMNMIPLLKSVCRPPQTVCTTSGHASDETTDALPVDLFPDLD